MLSDYRDTLLKLEIGPGYTMSGANGYAFNPHVCGLGLMDVIYLDIVPPRVSCRCDWVVADAQFLPFRDNVFDEIHAHHVLEHLDNPLKALIEVRRVLRRGGYLHASVPNFLSKDAYRDPTHKHVFNLIKLWRLFKKAGLRPHLPALIGSRIPRPLLGLLKVVVAFLSNTLYMVGEKP